MIMPMQIRITQIAKREKRELALYKEEIEKYNMRRKKLHKSITIICVAVGIALITAGIYF